MNRSQKNETCFFVIPKGILVPLLLLFCASSVLAQNNIVISGKVKDEETGKPIAYATISIKNKARGVVSNTVGEFDFTFPGTSINDSIAISTIGYATQTHSIRNLVNQGTILFKLKPKPIILDEVVINDQMLSPVEIVKKAITNIAFNYPREPYMLEAFYRDYKTENGKCIGLIESAISIYDNGYFKPKSKFRLQERVTLKHLRKIVTADYQVDIYKNWNLLNELLRTNDVRYVAKSLEIKSRKYELERFSSLDDQLVYVIKTDGPWTSYLYIDTESFAVLKVELDAKWDGDLQNEWIMNDSVMNRTSYVKKTLKFKQYDGKYYPVYNNYSGQIEAYSKSTGKQLFTTDFFQEILVNNVLTEGIKKPDKKDLMHRDMALELQSNPYDEAFWKSYNIIKQNPLEQKLIRDLEEEISMEKQFRQSN